MVIKIEMNMGFSSFWEIMNPVCMEIKIQEAISGNLLYLDSHILYKVIVDSRFHLKL